MQWPCPRLGHSSKLSAQRLTDRARSKVSAQRLPDLAPLRHTRPNRRPTLSQGPHLALPLARVLCPHIATSKTSLWSNAYRLRNASRPHPAPTLLARALTRFRRSARPGRRLPPACRLTPSRSAHGGPRPGPDRPLPRRPVRHHRHHRHARGNT